MWIFKGMFSGSKWLYNRPVIHTWILAVHSFLSSNAAKTTRWFRSDLDKGSYPEVDILPCWRNKRTNSRLRSRSYRDHWMGYPQWHLWDLCLTARWNERVLNGTMEEWNTLMLLGKNIAQYTFVSRKTIINFKWLIHRYIEQCSIVKITLRISYFGPLFVYNVQRRSFEKKLNYVHNLGTYV